MTEPGPLQKNADAYRTISEVAADLKLPQHVLRFWETRFAQIKPLKRAGGRRFYRPEDVELLRAVKSLLYADGYTIKGVQRILREQGPRAVALLAASPGPRQAGREPRRADLGGEAAAAPMAFSIETLRDHGPTIESDTAPTLLGEAHESRGTAARLRLVLDEIDECVRLLATARGEASRR